jgi:hypothetical protein
MKPNVIIANPIYDTVFKHLMENNRVARFFVETIIDQPVESIAVTQQERTYVKDLTELKATGQLPDEFKHFDYLSVIRYDFVATIRTEDGGYKKVLIEIQKAKSDIDLMRFRDYIAEQYKRRDRITLDGVEIDTPLPIITIYLLGFKIPEVDAVVVHVCRTYHDVLGCRELQIKSNFIECLTHDSYVVQIPRIVPRVRTRLEALLSVFEQSKKIDEKGFIMQYCLDTDDGDIRLMVEILSYVAADPEKRKEIENEWWWDAYWDEFVTKNQMTIAEQRKALEENAKVIEENAKVIEENAKVIEENAKALEQNAKALEQKNNEIEELKRKLNIIT